MKRFVQCCCVLGVAGVSPFLGVGTCAAQAASATTLEDQLQTMYKPSIVDSDGTVASQGVVLTLVHGGLTTAPLQGSSLVCAQTFHSGKLERPSRMCELTQAHVPTSGEGGSSPMLSDGSAVEVTRIQVDRKKDMVRFDLVDSPTDARGGVLPAARKAVLNFEFPKGYLGNADAGQLSDVIGQELQPMNAGAGAPAGPGGQTGPSQAPGPPPQPQPAPTQLQMGMTTAQVSAAMGQPATVAKAGAKTIWVYQGLKITFQNDRVVDIQ